MTKLFPSPLYRWTKRENVRLGVLYDPKTGKVSPVKPKKLNKRSRGRHSAGSAPYWNRWVIGKDAEAVSTSGTRYCLGTDCEFDPSTVNPNFYGKGSTSWEYWDGMRYCGVNCYISNWSGQTGGQWIVEYGCCLIHDIVYYSRWDQIGCHARSVDSGRIYFGDADDEHAYRASHDFYGWAKGWVAGITWNELHSNPQTSAEWPASGYRIVNPDPVFSQYVYGLTERIEEGDQTLSGLNVATATAFVNCLDQLPTLMDQNHIADILDILSTLRSFRDGFVAEKGLDLLSSAWMGYRYAYSTTMGDINETVELLNRLGDLLKATALRAHGTAFTSDGWRVKCSLTISTDEFEGLMSKCQKYGNALTGYAMWDMVPYSFIVDWFVDIGGWLDFAEKQKISYKLDPSSCWYSIERKWTNEFGFEEIYYQRFMWDVHQSLAQYTSHGAGRVTICKRVLDILAMIH